jgi:hypothetical protein
MVNERTLELVEACLNGIFRDFLGNVSLVTDDVGDEPCVVIETADQKCEIYKRYEDVERRSISGTRTIKLARYVVTSFSYDTGVRYYPDGSGQPPGWEIEDVGKFDTFPDMLNWIVGGITRGIIDDTLLCAEMARGDEWESPNEMEIDE